MDGSVVKCTHALKEAHPHEHTACGLVKVGRVSGRAVCTAAHLCYSSMSFRPGSRGGEQSWMEGRRGSHRAHSTPHPVALCSPTASPPSHTHTHCPSFTTSAPRPQSLLLKHGSVQKRMHGKGQIDPRLPRPHWTWPGPEGRKRRGNGWTTVHVFDKTELWKWHWFDTDLYQFGL